MALHRVRRGLRLPIAGAPIQQIESGKSTQTVGLIAEDYVGLRPTMHVTVGDSVRRGQLLMEDKKNLGVRHTSPAAGTVRAVHRGDRRALSSIVIDVDRADHEGSSRGADEVSFSSFSGRHPNGLTGDEVRELLVESGAWLALRGRPFSRVANPNQRPHSIFVTAMDTNPLAADVNEVIRGSEDAFERGLFAVAKLTEGPIFVCSGVESQFHLPDFSRLQHEQFEGPHPAGVVGLHIHKLDPVDRSKMVWHLNYQDVIGIGMLFQTGSLSVSRIVSLAGPSVMRPRLVRTRLGASLAGLVEGELIAGEHRIISGSVFSGRRAPSGESGYLGRYHLQVSVIAEERTREFLGWLAPGFNKFSIGNTFISRLLPGKQFAFTTSTQGSKRAIIPIGVYERVMPMDLLPTFLARAIVMRDTERAEELGCLELDEEDMALCSFVCPGKTDFSTPLRDVLNELEKEG